MLVSVFTRTDTRSKVIGAAMARGIQAAGDSALITPTPYYGGPGTDDVALFYGYKGTCKEIMADYLKAGKRVVYIDRGYFGKSKGDADHYGGYHRFAIDAIHPTPEQVMKASGSIDRWRRHGITPMPRRPGSIILLAGMSPNQAKKIGLEPNEWEEKAVVGLQKHSDRIIFYRPKPSWTDATALQGTVDARATNLSMLLRDCHLTVSHHSNVAIDGLLAGVPGMVETGPASGICPPDNDLDKPFFPDDMMRMQFLSGLSYWQWNKDEMVSGEAWKFLRNQF